MKVRADISHQNHILQIEYTRIIIWHISFVINPKISKCYSIIPKLMTQSGPSSKSPFSPSRTNYPNSKVLDQICVNIENYREEILAKNHEKDNDDALIKRSD